MHTPEAYRRRVAVYSSKLNQQLIDTAECYGRRVSRCTAAMSLQCPLHLTKLTTLCTSLRLGNQSLRRVCLCVPASTSVVVDVAASVVVLVPLAERGPEIGSDGKQNMYGQAHESHLSSLHVRSVPCKSCRDDKVMRPHVVNNQNLSNARR